jgi:hypothetical protein
VNGYGLAKPNEIRPSIPFNLSGMGQQIIEDAERINLAETKATDPIDPLDPTASTMDSKEDIREEEKIARKNKLESEVFNLAITDLELNAKQRMKRWFLLAGVNMLLASKPNNEYIYDNVEPPSSKAIPIMVRFSSMLPFFDSPFWNNASVSEIERTIEACRDPAFAFVMLFRFVFSFFFLRA